MVGWHRGQSSVHGPGRYTLEHSYHQNRPSRVVKEDKKFFLMRGKNLNIPMEIGKLRTYKMPGSRMVVRRPSQKQLWFAFVTLAAAALALVVESE